MQAGLQTRPDLHFMLKTLPAGAGQARLHVPSQGLQRVSRNMPGMAHSYCSGPGLAGSTPACTIEEAGATSCSSAELLMASPACVQEKVEVVFVAHAGCTSSLAGKAGRQDRSAAIAD